MLSIQWTRRQAKGAKDFLIRNQKFNNDAIQAETWTKAGSARICIFDESKFPGRQMTAKIVELVHRILSLWKTALI